MCSHGQLLVVLLETTVLYITFRGADISYRWGVAFQIISSQFGLPQMEPSHVGTSEFHRSEHKNFGFDSISLEV